MATAASIAMPSARVGWRPFSSAGAGARGLLVGESRALQGEVSLSQVLSLVRAPDAPSDLALVEHPFRSGRVLVAARHRSARLHT